VNSVLTPRRPGPPRLAGTAIALIDLALAVGVLLLLRGLGEREGPPSRQLTVDNQTTYDVNVEVTGVNRDRWLDVGYFRRETRRRVEEVADQGREWVFRFSYGGFRAGDLVVSREQLMRDGWRITVPPNVAERLREAGLSESAR
jgi:hypothetical protein